MHDFTLDPRLAGDTMPVMRLAVCELLLMNDQRWPWLILVPARAGLEEIFDLSAAERATVSEEAAAASTALKRLTGATKINVGALGNVVRQLHVHVVARSETDAAWPGPVWGFGKAEPYGKGEAQALVVKMRDAMGQAS